MGCEKFDSLIDRLEKTGSSLLVIKGDRQLFSSRESGLTPLVRCIERCGRDLEGSIAVDKVVGGAAARLFVLAKVLQVYTPVISTVGKEILTKNEIANFAYSEVPYISNEGDNPCHLEKLSWEISDGERFFRIVKERSA